MTITNNPSRDEYTATAGQVVFNYTFKIFSGDELDVYVTPFGQSPDDSADLTTDYVVDPATVGDEGGGFITFNTPLSAGDAVSIVSGIPYDRTVDYQQNGDFLPVTVNNDNDRQVAQIKQVLELARKAVVFGQASQGTSGLTSEPPIAGQFIRWKQDLSGFENVPISQLPDGVIPSDSIIYVFDSVADLKASDLSVGIVAVTKGYNLIGDGGQAFYVVDSPKVVDGFGDHQLSNGNTALIQTNGSLSIRQYGAFPSSDALNNDAAIAAAIAANSVVTAPIGSYKISSTINIPASKALLGEGVGSNPNLAPSGNDATVFSYSGVGDAISVNGSGFRVKDFAILDELSTASSGLFINGDGNEINGGVAENILIHNFQSGTSHKLFAANSGFIAYCKFNIRSRFANIGVHIDTDLSGSFCSTNQWEGGAINGGTATNGIRSEGAISNDNRFIGTSVEISSTTEGSIFVDGSSNIVFDGRLEATQQPSVDINVPVVFCGAGTSDCSIGGLGAAGLIIDEGNGNSITFNSSKTPQPVRSTDNLIKNANFSKVTASSIEDWVVTGVGVSLSVSDSIFLESAKTLTVTIPAGTVSTIYQQFSPAFFGGNSFTMGCYIGSSSPLSAVSWFSDAGAGITAGQPHPGDGSTIWLGHIKDTPDSPPYIRVGLSMNNTTGSPISITLTMPIAVTGFHLPIAQPARLNESKAVMKGVFSDNFGTDGVAASQMVLSRDGNKYVVSGAALITRINQSAADRFPDGTTIKIYAAAAGVTLSDNAFLLLSGNFTSVSQWDNITLTHIGAGVWVEDARTFV